MDDALAVRVVQRLGHLVDDADGLAHRQQPVRLAEALQRLCPVHVLHDQVAQLAFHVSVVDVEDVGMVEDAGRVRLVEEQLAEAQPFLALVHELGVRDLDRDDAVGEGVVGGVDRAHGALAHLVDDLVLADLVRNGGHGRRCSDCWTAPLQARRTTSHGTRDERRICLF